VRVQVPPSPPTATRISISSSKLTVSRKCLVQAIGM
jgi:hypothetical protein